jgi:hypothetical protein
MRNANNKLRCFALAVALAFQPLAAWAHVTPEDQKLIDAASCEEIIKQYKIHVAEEKLVVEEIRKTTNSTVAGNVVGAAMLATIGIGFFSWDNSVDAETNLAELRAYRQAIGEAGRRKKCDMPAP